jgi:hypothetical protein
MQMSGLDSGDAPGNRFGVGRDVSLFTVRMDEPRLERL